MKTHLMVGEILLLLLANSLNNATGQPLTTLYNFGGPTNGANPSAGLIQSSDGFFYGTTANGGTNNSGTIFQISATGLLTNAYQFSGADGANPVAGLIQGSDGYFYGTTANGGINQSGTVFQISVIGSLTNLHQFSGPDGADPEAGIVQGNDGYFYGTTYHGGTNSFGTVFKISSSGVFTSLHSFVVSDGAFPDGALVQGRDGSFYGTTTAGGTNGGFGTVFKISATGLFTNLYSFSADAANPMMTLVQGSDGNFYGTTCCTVFKISSAGSLTTLHPFNIYVGGRTLVQGSDGNFYGMTGAGGMGFHGTVFQMDPVGNFQTVYTFSGGADGGNPVGGLVQGSDGSFYGMTNTGGTNSLGTVFKATFSLNPPANQISKLQRVSTNVVISIPSVVGETYQLQYRGSMNTGGWSNVAGATPTNGIGGTLAVTNFGGALPTQGFYRFDITP